MLRSLAFANSYVRDRRARDVQTAQPPRFLRDAATLRRRSSGRNRRGIREHDLERRPADAVAEDDRRVQPDAGTRSAAASPAAETRGCGEAGCATEARAA